MTKGVYSGEYYHVVGTAHDWGVSFSVNPAKTTPQYPKVPPVRFSDGHFYVEGYRKPNRGLKRLFGRRLSIQEAAAAAVDLCRLGDEQHARRIQEHAESAAELRAAAEVQKIVAGL